MILMNINCRSLYHKQLLTSTQRKVRHQLMLANLLENLLHRSQNLGVAFRGNNYNNDDYDF